MTPYYNTDRATWEGYIMAAVANGDTNSPLIVVDGYVFEVRDALARFRSSADAQATLLSAGLVQLDGRFYAK